MKTDELKAELKRLHVETAENVVRRHLNSKLFGTIADFCAEERERALLAAEEMKRILDETHSKKSE